MDEQKEKHHVYDDIVEHDNPLPTWWLTSFFICIAFAVFYYVRYEIAGGPTLKDELAVAMADLEKSAPPPTAEASETEESLVQAFNAAGLVEKGATQFAQRCFPCHGNELQGLIGPDLTDKYWIHGKGTRLDIIKVVRDGIPDKGMPPWGPIMKKEEIYAVSAFILSKKGSNPKGSKGPQGEFVESY